LTSTTASYAVAYVTPRLICILQIITYRERNRTKRRTEDSHHDTCAVAAVVGSCDKTTLSSEEIRPGALAIIELCMCEGITTSMTKIGNFAMNRDHSKKPISADMEI